MNPNEILSCTIGILGSTLLSYVIQKLKESHKILEFGKITIKSESNKDINKDIFATFIWTTNRGNCNIEPKDFAPNSPLKIIISNGKLFNEKNFTKRSFYKPDTNNFRIKVKKNVIEIIFDFWSPNDRITLFFLHTGAINIKGFLKDGDIMDSDTINNIRIKNIIMYATIFLIITTAILLSFTLIDGITFFLGGITGIILTVLNYKIKFIKMKEESKKALYNWIAIRAKNH